MILDNKAVSNKILEDVKEEIKSLDKTPTLALMRIGNNLGSISYENSIKKNLEPLGINIEPIVLDENISEEDFLKKLKELNQDEHIHGIMIFKPLPEHISDEKVSLTIDPKKDVDSLSPTNLGKVLLGDPTGLVPCTAEGVIEVLDFYDIDVKGKDITIINNSDIIGKPLSMLLTNRYATVTLCHEFTEDLSSYTKDSDIVISGAGVYGLLTPDMFGDKTTLIDVAVTALKDEKGEPVRDKNGRIIRAGDAREDVKETVENILSLTPGSGGGTGPITTALLAKNVLKSFKILEGTFDIDHNKE